MAAFFEKIKRFISPTNNFIGLSIGSSSIKLVELKKVKNSWALLHFGMIQLPAGVINNREIINPIAVTDHIKELIKQVNVSNHLVCASLSGASVLVKRMTLDVPHLEELQDQVFWEAEQYLPFDVSEVFMDYQILSRNKNNQTDLMFVAVKKTMLEAYSSCILDAGLKAHVIDIDFFALQNTFEINYQLTATEAAALVEIGSDSTKIEIIYNKIPVFTKDINLGGHSLTTEIQKILKISYADAESLKIGAGQQATTPQEISELLANMCEQISSEIKKALDFYHGSSLGPAVTFILLSGGSARIPGLSKMIEASLTLPTQIMNPFNAITCDPRLFSQDYLQKISTFASVPIGLALRLGDN